MGRLEDIVHRNQNPQRNERVAVGIGIALFILLILALMTLTDLGKPNFAPDPQPEKLDRSGDKHVDDVKLR